MTATIHFLPVRRDPIDEGLKYIRPEDRPRARELLAEIGKALCKLPVKRVRPLERHELPDYWPEDEKSLYVQSTCTGQRSHESAFAHAEAMAEVGAQHDHELTEDYLMRRFMAGYAAWQATRD